MKIVKMIVLLLIIIILYVMNEMRMSLIIFLVLMVMVRVILEPDSNLNSKRKSELSEQAMKLADRKKSRWRR